MNEEVSQPDPRPWATATGGKVPDPSNQRISDSGSNKQAADQRKQVANEAKHVDVGENRPRKHVGGGNPRNSTTSGATDNSQPGVVKASGNGGHTWSRVVQGGSPSRNGGDHPVWAKEREERVVASMVTSLETAKTEGIVRALFQTEKKIRRTVISTKTNAVQKLADEGVLEAWQTVLDGRNLDRKWGIVVEAKAVPDRTKYADIMASIRKKAIAVANDTKIADVNPFQGGLMIVLNKPILLRNGESIPDVGTVKHSIPLDNNLVVACMQWWCSEEERKSVGKWMWEKLLVAKPVLQSTHGRDVYAVFEGPQWFLEDFKVISVDGIDVIKPINLDPNGCHKCGRRGHRVFACKAKFERPMSQNAEYEPTEEELMQKRRRDEEEKRRRDEKQRAAREAEEALKEAEATRKAAIEEASRRQREESEAREVEEAERKRRQVEVDAQAVAAQVAGEKADDTLFGDDTNEGRDEAEANTDEEAEIERLQIELAVEAEQTRAAAAKHVDVVDMVDVDETEDVAPTLVEAELTMGAGEAEPISMATEQAPKADSETREPTDDTLESEERFSDPTQIRVPKEEWDAWLTELITEGDAEYANSVINHLVPAVDDEESINRIMDVWRISHGARVDRAVKEKQPLPTFDAVELRKGLLGRAVSKQTAMKYHKGVGYINDFMYGDGKVGDCGPAVMAAILNSRGGGKTRGTLDVRREVNSMLGKASDKKREWWTGEVFGKAAKLWKLNLLVINPGAGGWYAFCAAHMEGDSGDHTYFVIGGQHLANHWALWSNDKWEGATHRTLPEMWAKFNTDPRDWVWDNRVKRSVEGPGSKESPLAVEEEKPVVAATSVTKSAAKKAAAAHDHKVPNTRSGKIAAANGAPNAK